MFLRMIAALAALMVMVTPLRAEELGPAVGETIPHDLTLADADGTAQDFDSLVGEQGMALFFVRSLDWCPFCKKQATDVNERYDEFTKRGLSVVVVSYDAPEKLKAFSAANDFAPVALSDANIDAINAFGIRNEQHTEGRFYGIPHPVVFIVDTDKTVVAKFYEEDFATNNRSYAKRPAVDVILDGVDAAFAD